MSNRANKQESNLPTVMRRIRESSGLTMRQAGGIIGISHVAISQFENRKLELPAYRIEQMVKAYGFTMDEFAKIMGRGPSINIKDDCLAMLQRLDDEQLVAVHAVMGQLLRTFNCASVVRQPTQGEVA